MRCLLQTFGEILFVDGTYKLNKNNYPVILLIVTDQNRHSRVVGVAIIAFERQLVLKIIIDFFKSLNDTKVIKYVMIDKDLKEDNVLSEAFPNSRLLYCFWHVEKIFKRRYKTSQNFQLCKQMMLAETEEDFNSKKDEFLRLNAANQKELKYLRDNWLDCLEKWAKFKRHGLTLNLQETNNPCESINKQLKNTYKRHSKVSLAKCLDIILTYLKTTEFKIRRA